MKDQDLLHPFLFDNSDVRGNAVHLSNTIQQALQHSEYPAVLRTALTELMAAAALLTSTVKLDNGTLTFQIQGQGPLSLLVVECNSALKMRATAKWQGDIAGLGFKELVGLGNFVITLDPKDGGQSYQGIVDVVGDNIAQILENYMHQSAQLQTKIWLSSSHNEAAGLLLQKLPQHETDDQDTWQRTTVLAETVQHDELLQLDTQTLLRRLFHEENVRLFDSKPVAFECRCSQQSVSNMLRLLGREEVDSIIQEQGRIKVNCDFCNAEYLFDPIDASQLFVNQMPTGESRSLH